MSDATKGCDDYKPGDRVLAILTWGHVLSKCPFDSQRLLVHLDTGFIQSFHWAECYAEKDVVEVKP
jgi:hypothetical protein